jgi:hypothetical protein
VQHLVCGGAGPVPGSSLARSAIRPASGNPTRAAPTLYDASIEAPPGTSGRYRTGRTSRVLDCANGRRLGVGVRPLELELGTGFRCTVPRRILAAVDAATKPSRHGTRGASRQPRFVLIGSRRCSSTWWRFRHRPTRW